METRTIDLKLAAQDLAATVRELISSGDRAFLVDDDGVVLALLSPRLPPAPVKKEDIDAEVAAWNAEAGYEHYVRSPIDGHWVVAARPDQHEISSEELYEIIRGCVP